jgi:KTSC domain-containing protein/DUF3006 family protein
VSAGAAGMTRHSDDVRIRAVHFDRSTRTLRVELENGAVYDYADVPERVYDELARAPSRDSYFREHVRDEFIGSRVGEVDLAEMAHERREDSMFGAPLAERTSDPADVPAAGPPRHDAERRASHHTWIVDVIEDDAAAVEVDGRRVTPIPRWLLPTDAKDGDVLRVSHSRSASRSIFTIEVDHDATRLTYERSAEQLRNAPPGGTGDLDLNA